MRSKAFPPRHTLTRPVPSCRSASASLVRNAWMRIVMAYRSAAVAYPRTRPARFPAATASRASIRLMRATREPRSASRLRQASW